MLILHKKKKKVDLKYKSPLTVYLGMTGGTGRVDTPTMQSYNPFSWFTSYATPAFHSSTR